MNRNVLVLAVAVVVLSAVATCQGQQFHIDPFFGQGYRGSFFRRTPGKPSQAATAVWFECDDESDCADVPETVNTGDPDVCLEAEAGEDKCICLKDPYYSSYVASIGRCEDPCKLKFVVDRTGIPTRSSGRKEEPQGEEE